MLVGHATAVLKAAGASSRPFEGFNLGLQKWSILQVQASIWLMIVLSFGVPASQINQNLVKVLKIAVSLLVRAT